ncbi:MAG TPA: GntR family transcriptional regulator [Phycisphaerae bacterium]|nr:GntR family transcriptional regulator [Phycisphaerae bacterium]
MAEPRRHKYREVFEHVYQGILRGRYRPGSRIPTEMELATRFDASRMTVSRALRDLQSQGLLQRRHGAGTFVQEVPRQENGTVGLMFPVFPGFHTGVFDAVTVELTRQIQAAGYGLFLGHPLHGGVNAVLENPEKICEPYLERGLCCVFFTPVELPAEQMAANVEIVKTFEREGIPVVLLDRDICDFPARSRHDLIGVDNFGAAYILTQHLLSLGHRRIHFVGTSAVATTISARIMGYQAALVQHGIMPEASWVHRGDPRLLEFARQLDPGSTDAFLCSNDHVAAILLRHFVTLGVRVPDDVAVVGFDDTPFAALLAPPLTTVRQPAVALGAAAMRVMVERLEDSTLPPREIRLPSELVVRESCGALLRGGAKQVQPQAGAPGTPAGNAAPEPKARRSSSGTGDRRKKKV